MLSPRPSVGPLPPPGGSPRQAVPLQEAFIVENRGQFSDMGSRLRPDIRFVLFAGRMRVFILDTGLSFVLTLPSVHGGDASHDHREDPFEVVEADEIDVNVERVDIEFVGSNPAIAARGIEPLGWYANFYTAAAPDGVTHLSTYGGAVLENVWPGIDMTIEIAEKGVKYSFVVHPNGRAADIALRYSDNARPVVRETGDLDIPCSLFALHDEAPTCFGKQDAGSYSIPCSFALEGQTVRFPLEAPSPGKELTIDPTLSWATYVNTPGNDYAGGIDIDNDDNVWSCGSTSGTNFPTTPGTFQYTRSSAPNDGYVIKFTPAGTRLWATYYAGADVTAGMSSDRNYNMYVTGTTSYTAFPVSPGAFQSVKSTSYDGFLVKMLSDGTRGWATLFGGDGGDIGIGTTVDGRGNLYLTGQTGSTNLTVTPGAFQTVYGGSNDGFLAKFDSSGRLIWSTYIGSSTSQYGHSCSTDYYDNVLVIGTTGSGFPTTSGVLQSTFPGGSTSAYIIKFDSAGARQWATYFGSSTTGYGIRCFGNDALIVGWTSGTIPITSGAFQPNRPGGDDGWFARLNPTGTAVVWSTYFGGNQMDHVTSIKVNPSGTLHVTGCTFSANFPVTSGAPQTVYAGNEDRFVAQFSAQGQRCWATFIGGTGQDHCWTSPPIGDRPEHSITIASNADFYVIGNTTGGFPTTPGSFRPNYAGGDETFLVRYVNDCNGMIQARAGNDVTICRGDSATIGLPAVGSPCTTPYTYSWSPPTGLSATNVDQPRAFPTQTTTYVVTVTDAISCVSSDTVVVTVIDIDADIAPDTSFICPGGTAVLRATAGTGYTYTWLRNGTPVSGATSAVYTATQTGMYRVVIRNSQGCFDTSDVAYVLPGTGPGATLTATGPTSFCAGDSVVLLANTGVRLTYVWQRNGATIAGATSSSYTAKEAGVYRVIVSDTLGCRDTSAAVTVTILPGPGATLTALGPTTFCIGGSVELRANTGAGLTYTWQKDNTTIPGATASSYTARESGSYRVIVTGSNGCRDTSAAMVVAVVPGPGAVIVPPGPVAICDGDGVVLGANTAPGLTYVWQRDKSTIAGAAGPNYTATREGLYRVIVINAAGCRDTSDEVLVTMYPRPDVALSAAGPTVFCEPGSVLLNASSKEGVTYTWHRNGTPIPGTSGKSYTASESGRYTVVVVDANGCSDTSDAVVVTVHPKPDATLSPLGPVRLCEGQTQQLTTVQGTGYTYTWLRDGTIITGASGPSYTVFKAGNYRVIVVTAYGCADTSDIVSVTVVPLPERRIEGKTSVCPNTTADYFVSNSAGLEFSWSVKNGSIQDGQYTPRIKVYWQTPGIGEVRVTITDAATGCSRDTVLKVSITSALRPVIVANGTGVLCEGDSIVLDAGPGYLSYEWSRDGNPLGAKTRFIVVRQGGSYTVYVTDGGGCNGTSPPFAVTVNRNPVITLSAGGPTVFCKGGSVLLTASSSPEADIVWYRDGKEILGASGNTFVATQPGVYTASGITKAGCPGTSDSILVEVKEAPKAEIAAGGPTVFCVGDSVVLSAGPATGVRYTWLKDGVLLPGAVSRLLVVRESGMYRVIVTETSAGCADTSDAVAVVAHPLPDAGIDGPQAFCEGESATLTARNKDGRWLWSTGAATRSIVVTAPGKYALTVTDSSGCRASSEVTVAMHPAPKLVVAGSRSMCRNGQTTLDAGPSFTRYRWSTGDTTRRLVVRSPGLYWVSVFDANGCSARDTVLVTESDEIAPTISGRAVLCPGGSLLLEADSNETYTRYIWTTAADTTVYLATTRLFTVTAPGRYLLRVTDQGGCSGSASIEVVLASSRLDVRARGYVCRGLPPDSLEAAEGFVSYRWNTGSDRRTLVADRPGIYTVAATDTNGCVWVDSVVVVERLVQPVMTGSRTFCTGGSTRLTAWWPSAAAYFWSTSDSGRETVVRKEGEVWVRVVDSSGCEGIVTDTVRETTTLTLSVAGARNICHGASTVLDAGPDMLWYRWTTEDTNVVLSTIRTLVVTEPGVYIVQAADSGGCRGADTVRVARFPPVALRVRGDTAFCTGGTARISATPGMRRYLWSTNETSESIVVSKSGVYAVTVTDTNGCTA
ncbi:MAG: hypothetical protein QHI48_07865, partial [Bacteroidota bacterium]|nr:hypothetical protein [Bacteroidota bacterium]